MPGITTPIDSETIAKSAWEAWHKVDAEQTATHRVYGVAMHASGDAIFQLGPRSVIEVVTGGGYLATPASNEWLYLLDRCIWQGNFMVCVQPRRGSTNCKPILRYYPGKQAGWSTKSLHPDIGGLGSVDATILS